MRFLSLLVFVMVFQTTLLANTPFNLHGVKKLSVHVADYSEMFDEKMKLKLETMMQKSLKKLSINTKGYFHQSFILLMQSQMLGEIKVLNLELMISGDVKPSGSKDLTFGITYLLRDSVEVEDKESDVVESLEFLLDEFSEQYIEDNKE